MIAITVEDESLVMGVGQGAVEIEPEETESDGSYIVKVRLTDGNCLLVLDSRELACLTGISVGEHAAGVFAALFAKTRSQLNITTIYEDRVPDYDNNMFVCLACGKFADGWGTPCKRCRETSCVVPARRVDGEWRSPVSYGVDFASRLAHDIEQYTRSDFHTLLATSLALTEWDRVPVPIQGMMLRAVLSARGLPYDEYANIETNEETNGGSIYLSDNLPWQEPDGGIALSDPAW